MSTLAPRLARESEIVLHQLMLPEHANMQGNVHGGVVLKLVDEAGAICAMRHARRACVTVAIDSMHFRSPVHVGQLLRCRGWVSWTGRTSLEVSMEVEAEDPITGQVVATHSGHAVYVALDATGQSTAVPPLVLESDAQRLAWDRAEARRRERLAHRE